MTSPDRVVVLFPGAMARREAGAAVARDAQATLQNGDGDGTSGGMDPWQQSVEKRLDKLDTNTSKLTVDLAVLTERVGHLPTKGFIVSALLTVLAVLAALNIFGPNIRTMFGLH